MKEIESYLNDLEISGPDNLLDFELPLFYKYDGIESFNTDSTILNYKCLNSFVAGVSVQSQQDVLNSFLLAQRGATKAFPKDHEIINWYRKYFEILGRLGWVFENKDFVDLNFKSSLFELDKVILEILGSLLPAKQISIIGKTLKSIKSLGDNDKRILAFEKSTHTSNRGSFQLGIVTEENEALHVSANAYVLSSNTRINRILFFNSKKDEFNFQYLTTNATLNKFIYVKVRELVRERLGDVTSYIADLEI